MFEDFFGMKHTPFTRNVPPERLYESASTANILGRLGYVADRQLFAVLTSDAGCGKSTMIRKFADSLSRDEYILLYLSDSKLTPSWLYKGMQNGTVTGQQGHNTRPARDTIPGQKLL